jgi:hypothetical protein
MQWQSHVKAENDTLNSFFKIKNKKRELVLNF